MALGGGKIAGHSGTDFKHRVAYSAIKKYNRKNNPPSKHRSSNPKPPSRYQYNESTIFLNLTSTLILILTFLIVGFLFFQETAPLVLKTTDYEQLRLTREAIRQQEFNDSRLTNFSYYLNVGELYYNRGNQEAAQANFQKALSYTDKEQDIYVKYARSLSEQCYQDGYNCNTAAAYIEYVANKQLVSNSEINALRAKVTAGVNKFTH